MERKDLISGSLWLLLFIITFVMVSSMPENAAYWPRAISIVGIIISIYVIAKSYILLRKEQQSTEKKPQDVLVSFKSNKAFITFIIVLMILLWVVLLNIIGFIITNIAFMLGMMSYRQNLEKKSTLLVYLTISVLFTLTIWGTFDYFLGVRLPKGYLF